MSIFDRWRRWPEDTAGDGEPRDPELAALLERARALPREAEPERDLVAGIANRIREAEREPAPARGFASLRASFPRPALAAAAGLALVVATALVTSYAMRGPTIPTTEAEFAALADELRERDGVAQVHADLMSILEARRDALPAETFAALEDNVRSLDRAIAELHIALLEHPDDTGLVFLLAETYRREAELLERIEWWMETLPEENAS